ncbi:MAG: 2-C-methyl-D-erythritol 4-phosphate cytidylyltransferase [Planctomycetes bacterium]|nr:2-C-methyl-D-erythritol 4-phosphate cytidylyltransferase [Planctomycetota bacterium]
MTTVRRDLGAIVVAAGRSTRMGGTTPKVWLPYRGEPLLVSSLRTIAAVESLAAVVLVVREEELARAEALRPSLPAPLRERLHVVAGGRERSDSVRCGLAALAAAAPSIVLVHDAARPNASRSLFERVAAAAREHGAAVPGLPIVDTLRRRSADGRSATVDRSGLHAVQTPQGFARELLERAHAQPADAAATTDDAMLVEALGAPIAWVDGEAANLKVTLPADLELAARLAGGATMERRVGLGHDLHRLAPGGPLRLGGVDLAGDVHAVGHSDGDALLHAVTDALLGACALGDIGTHFSDKAAENRGRDSAEFLRHAIALAAQRGFAPLQVDVVVRLEKPKLAPHRAALVARLAELLGLPLDAVSIKAKTAEGVDAIGEGRALACDAVVQMGRS